MLNVKFDTAHTAAASSMGTLHAGVPRAFASDVAASPLPHNGTPVFFFALPPIADELKSIRNPQGERRFYPIDRHGATLDLFSFRDVDSVEPPLSPASLDGIGKGVLEDHVNDLYCRSSLVDPEVYVQLLRGCGQAKDLALGRLVHDHVIARGLGQMVPVCDSLIQMYGRCGAIQQSRAIFDQMPQRTMRSWNMMISAYTDVGQTKKALLLFHHLNESDEIMNEAIAITVLNTCKSKAELTEGRYIHSCIIAHGLESNLVAATVLMNMYGRCECIEDAQRTFNKLQEWDVVAWNSIISAQVQQELSTNTFYTYKKMKEEGFFPDCVTFLVLLEACSALSDLCKGRIMHSHVVDSGLDDSIMVNNALINMYSKCGSLEDATIAFMRMDDCDAVSWNSVIAAYTQHGFGQEAIELYGKMVDQGFKPNDFTFSTIISACASVSALREGTNIHSMIIKQGLESDLVVATALIYMYTKCRCVEEARNLFDALYLRSVHAWTIMIFAYAQYGHGAEALELFHQMQLGGLKPDEITYTSVLGACAILSDLDEGKRIHTSVQRLGLDLKAPVGPALINMYGKCGSLKDAKMVFDKMPEHNVMSWNALMAAYAQHGFGKEVLKIFSEMQAESAEPNEVTFVSVLSACSHEGLVDQGLHFFNSMQNDHVIMPAIGHYGCLVDLYARAGHLMKAEDVIESMPFPPNALIWQSLFGACCTYGDVERGKRAAVHAVRQNSERDSSYPVISNICAAADDRWYCTARIQKKMLETGVGHNIG